jgi:hypothetical protein
MPYRNFTIVQVQRQFQLNVSTNIFFADLPRLTASDWLTTLLRKSATFAATLGTEKARSELIIAPLLFEFRELLNCQIGLFSGADFSVAPELGLNGVCDFLLTRSSKVCLRRLDHLRDSFVSQSASPLVPSTYLFRFNDRNIGFAQIFIGNSLDLICRQGLNCVAKLAIEIQTQTH